MECFPTADLIDRDSKTALERLRRVEDLEKAEIGRNTAQSFLLDFRFPQSANLPPIDTLIPAQEASPGKGRRHCRTTLLFGPSAAEAAFIPPQKQGSKMWRTRSSGQQGQVSKVTMSR